MGQFGGEAGHSSVLLTGVDCTWVYGVNLSCGEG